MPASVYTQKLFRLRSGKAPRVLDLFAGCGGISLGLQRAGFEISAAIEFDEFAAASHGLNFHPSDTRHHTPKDITTTPPAQLAKDLGLGPVDRAFDVIVGGPPCQAFARVGRSKLREVADHPEAFRHDPRASLYIHYLDYVEACAPLAVLLENVPDMLNYGGRNIAREICDVLSDKGYVCRFTLLNAAHYGVPQMRERVFILALRKELGVEVQFPDATHNIDLPVGYSGTRAVALGQMDLAGDLGLRSFWAAAAKPATNLPPAITAQDAIEDLPKIDARAELRAKTLRRGARRFDQPINYVPLSKPNDYVSMMRDWPGFEGGDQIFDHVIRYLPRDYELFSRLKPGDQYPEAYREAERMFTEEIARLRKSGAKLKAGSQEWNKLRQSIVPPYDHTKFPNKWRKMEADKPARTLLAHLGKDSYSHIHYDSVQARPISVREAARLQSFPDGFRFAGTMNPAFRQIGNAVPPLLAYQIGCVLARQLKGMELGKPEMDVAYAGD